MNQEYDGTQEFPEQEDDLGEVQDPLEEPEVEPGEVETSETFMAEPEVIEPAAEQGNDTASGYPRSIPASENGAKSTNTTLIIIIVVLLLLVCICCICPLVFYFFLGDPLYEWFMDWFYTLHLPAFVELVAHP